MRSVLFALPLLAATTAFGQASPSFKLNHVYPLNQTPGQPGGYPVQGWNCPVGMTAERQATGATQWVVSLEDARVPAAEARAHASRMGVRVGLKALLAFREAKVAVSYQVPPAGVMLVDGAVSTETKTFALSAGDDPAQELERSLLLGTGINVTRVRLLSLTYADGTVWQPGANFSCSVRVSHLLPVAAAR